VAQLLPLQKRWVAQLLPFRLLNPTYRAFLSVFGPCIAAAGGAAAIDMLVNILDGKPSTVSDDVIRSLKAAMTGCMAAYCTVAIVAMCGGGPVAWLVGGGIGAACTTGAVIFCNAAFKNDPIKPFFCDLGLF